MMQDRDFYIKGFFYFIFIFFVIFPLTTTYSQSLNPDFVISYNIENYWTNDYYIPFSAPSPIDFSSTYKSFLDDNGLNSYPAYGSSPSTINNKYYFQQLSPVFENTSFPPTLRTLPRSSRQTTFSFNDVLNRLDTSETYEVDETDVNTIERESDIPESNLYTEDISDETVKPILNTDVKTVAIFKNGSGFFIREGTAISEDGCVVLEYVPRAALGSLWLESLDDNAVIDEVIAFNEEIEDEIKVSTMKDLITANLGQKVKITMRKMYDEEEEEVIEGIIKFASEEDYIDYIIIEAFAGDMAIAIKDIDFSKIEFPEGMSNQIQSKTEERRIKVKIDSPSNEMNLRLSYLQEGIIWTPSYLVDIECPEKAQITLKATVINDVEDLENTNAYFVVGYPSFIYSNILSPLSLEQSVSQFIKSLRQTIPYQPSYSPLANIMTQSVNFAQVGPTEEYSVFEDEDMLLDQSEADIFLYDKKGLNLAKGETGYYHLFLEEVDYEHIYEWELPNEHVWHSIRLTNSTNYPWTTAPAFVVSGWEAIAQGTINYTPKGSDINLKLTVAVDIKTDNYEYEINRVRDIILYAGDNRLFDLVTREGELYLKNFKEDDVTVNISTTLVGEVNTVTHNGKIEKIVTALQDVNYNSSISWEINLQGGEEITITYEYTIYEYQGIRPAEYKEIITVTPTVWDAKY
ncbi:MAG: hypothetical protein ACMUIP_13405 [bacterium]